MNPQQDEAHLAVEHARQALRNNNRGEARRLAERAASLAPELEDPWLILAAIASPHDSLEYIQRALEINPNSPRARKGMEWALERLRIEEGPQAQITDLRQDLLPAHTLISGEQQPATPSDTAPKHRNRRAIALALIVIGAVVFVAAGLTALRTPALASIIQQQVNPTRPVSWARVDIPKPTHTPAPQIALDMQQPLVDVPLTATPAGQSGSESLLPADQSADSVESAPTPGSDGASAGSSATGEPTELAVEQPTQELPPTEASSVGSLTMTYVEDAPTSAAVPGSANAPAASQGAGHWIDVNLSQQMVYAYDGDMLVNSFLASTGTWLHPTVTGQYHVYIKLRYADMTGPDYYLPNVPYTMYFFGSYGLHGTYWHHNFGTPMSHGCVNLSIPDAAWLYDFASVGTLVNVHY